MNFINNALNYLWSFYEDPKPQDKVNIPDSTQSYNNDNSSDSDSDYYDAWEDDDSGYGSDPFIALFLLTLIQGFMNHRALIRRIIIRRIIFKTLILLILGYFGYLPSWWDINSFYSSLSFWWDSISSANLKPYTTEDIN